MQQGSYQIKLYFKFLNFLGDNLGLHEILGFSPSFRVKHPCGICWISFDDINNVYCEDGVTLRNAENYYADVRELAHNVTEECVFHKGTLYRVYKNLCVDVMHDIFEGVAQYDLAKILHYYIYTKKHLP